MTFDQMMAVQRQIESGRKFTDSHQPDHYEVVWSGGELLPDRESIPDNRLLYVPSYDLDEGSGQRPDPPKRKYTRTGRHIGEFVRTHPRSIQ